MTEGGGVFLFAIFVGKYLMMKQTPEKKSHLNLVQLESNIPIFPQEPLVSISFYLKKNCLFYDTCNPILFLKILFYICFFWKKKLQYLFTNHLPPKKESPPQTDSTCQKGTESTKFPAIPRQHRARILGIFFPPRGAGKVTSHIYQGTRMGVPPTYVWAPWYLAGVQPWDSKKDFLTHKYPRDIGLIRSGFPMTGCVGRGTSIQLSPDLWIPQI